MRRCKTKSLLPATVPFIGLSAILLCGLMSQLVFEPVASYPIRASCLVLYSMEVACSNVSDRLVQWIHRLSGPDGCMQGGEVCNYELIAVVNQPHNHTIFATHTTPKKKFVDDLSFEFSTPVSDKGRCIVEAKSRSQLWYAHLDMGTNYCNLHNLVKRAGLEGAPAFTLHTNDAVCTQYSSANCSKY